jgi:hypothetical protein
LQSESEPHAQAVLAGTKRNSAATATTTADASFMASP